MLHINIHFLFISLITFQFLIWKAHTCEYTVTNISQIVTGINIPPLPFGFIPRSASANSLRIHFEYMASFNNYSRASDLIRDVMEPAKASLASMITVNNPTNGVLRVNRQCITNQFVINSNNEVVCSNGCARVSTCSSVAVPDKYLNKCRFANSEGVTSTSGSDGAGQPNVDIVILVTYDPCLTGNLAYANACFQESQLDRPILGIMNLCPDKIRAGINTRVNINIVKHELIHALGFAVDKYAFYRNQDGTPIVPRDAYGRPSLGISPQGFYLWNDKIIVPVNRARSSVSSNYYRPFNAFVLPNVVAVAREHFNCTLINEVELEDSGNRGSALSHFDQYVLFHEVMTAEINGWLDRLSKFTLALLKDTGWYDVDFSKAEDMHYGKNGGCILPLNGCYAYMESQRANNNTIDPFCDTAYGQILQCNPTRQYYEHCSIRKYSYVHAEYQYLKTVNGLSSYNPLNYAGWSMYSEYCPMKSVPYNINDGLNSDCTDTSNTGISSIYTPISSSYGNNSKCFDTTLIGQPIYGATCLQYNYNGNNINYPLFVGSQMMTCSDNITISFQLSYGVTASISCIKTSLLPVNNFKTCLIYSTGNSPTTGNSRTTYGVPTTGSSPTTRNSPTVGNSNVAKGTIQPQYSVTILWITLIKVFFI